MNILNIYNLSEKYENNKLGLLHKWLKEEKLYKAEIFDFQKIKKILKFQKKELILTKDGSLYHGFKKIKTLEDKKIIDIAVSTQFNFAFAITKDKKVYAWGENMYGQLGVGDLENRELPVQVSDLNGINIAQFEVGASHVALLTKDGQVYTWGENHNGQLGLGDIQNRTVSRKVKIFTGLEIQSLATGDYHTLALTKFGVVYSWGFDVGGHGDKAVNVRIPNYIHSLKNEVIVKITSGAIHSLALTAGGDVYAWGFNLSGQLGLGDWRHRNTPTLLKDLRDKGIIQLRGVGTHSFALTDTEPPTTKVVGFLHTNKFLQHLERILLLICFCKTLATNHPNG